MKTYHQQNSTPRKSLATMRCGGALVLVITTLLATPQLHAASASWNVDAGGNWNDNGNWNPAAAPGSTTVTNSTDIATFGTTITAARIITPDANRNVGGITFNHNSSFGYTIGGTLLLSSGGEILSNGSGTHIDLLSSMVELQGNGGSGTIRNISASSNTRLNINAVRGVSTIGNTTTLNLDGTNNAANTVSSTISNGTGGGALAVVKNGSGTWILSGNNTYSGGATLNAGTLTFTSTTAFGTGILSLNGGTLRANFAANATVANEIEVGGNFTHTLQSAGNLILSGNVDLGDATRTITTNTAGSNLTFSGVISNGGLTKAGVATSELTLEGINVYTGDTTVSSGILNLAQDAGLLFVIGNNGVNNKITGTGTVNLDGHFSFDLDGAEIVNGNSWNIIDVGTLTESFGSNFAVNDFTDAGGGAWTLTQGDFTWTFQQSTGILNVVPEPGTGVLLTLGGLTLLFRRRRGFQS